MCISTKRYETPKSPVDTSVPKFKVGDKVEYTNQNYGSVFGKTGRVTELGVLRDSARIEWDDGTDWPTVCQYQNLKLVQEEVKPTGFQKGDRVVYVGKHHNYHQEHMMGYQGAVVEQTTDSTTTVEWDKLTKHGLTESGVYPENLELLKETPKAPTVDEAKAVLEAAGYTVEAPLKAGDLVGPKDSFEVSWIVHTVLSKDQILIEGRLPSGDPSGSYAVRKVADLTRH